MATVIPYDVTGVEETPGQTGVKVKPGVHVARVDLIQKRETKASGDPANDLRVGLNFGEKYDWGFTYVGLGDASDWKLAEFVRSLGLKDKGRIDPAKHEKKTFIRVKVNPGTYGDQYSPDMGRLMKAQPGDNKLWEKGQPGIGMKVAEPDEEAGLEAEDAAEPETEDVADETAEEGFLASRESDPEVGSYDDWTEADLEAEVGDRELTVGGGRGKKKDKLIAALRADDEEFEGAGAEEEPEEEADEASDDGATDYSEMDLDALTVEWNARQLGDLPTFRGRGAGDRVKAAIIEGLEADDQENPFEG